ncbi:MAG: hypothetical protein CM1200mP23_2130 [Nitrososphaerota archaeon]|nr:MAG: hypothetical protein CM1200mP23_2130 [Nitrososphaerota archaeon]
MTDIIEVIAEYSYLGILFLLMRKCCTYFDASHLDHTFIIFFIGPFTDPFLLALVGATGATIGRFFFKKDKRFFPSICG